MLSKVNVDDEKWEKYINFNRLCFHHSVRVAQVQGAMDHFP